EIYTFPGISGIYHALIGTELNELHIQFDASSSYPAEDSYMYRPAQVHWSSGDGTEWTIQIASTAPSGWWMAPKMAAAYIYPAAGIYTVTLTLTDNLGYSDAVTQTITVGTPGDNDEEEEVQAEDFGLGVIYWELDDEEEEDCIYIEGTVQNNASVAAGVELTATAYNGLGNPVGTFTYWPAGSTNIGVGVDYAYSFFLCDLSVPGEQVVDVEVVVTDAIVY
ncbi:PKD domain-containing protein, partial [Candidatus Bipolaricaulota bacterium]|nr:PKD domain-containing protein [Candidatus Bipolaricaulota bacterium]